MTEIDSVYGNKPMLTYDITDERRNEYRRSALDAHAAKQRALTGQGPSPIHPVNVPRLRPDSLMPIVAEHTLRSLSLFSGGGGLDLGFDRAGYRHVASYDIIPICGDTLKSNRPDWNVFAGPMTGDVRRVDWSRYKEQVDVIHGGPPCQPFSVAGQQQGQSDERNMWGEFIRAIREVQPIAFVAENVLGLLSPKFSSFLEQELLGPLSDYHLDLFEMNAADYGVPQVRRRMILVGFKSRKNRERFSRPTPTHSCEHLKLREGQQALLDTGPTLPRTMGAREALGLPDIGVDGLAPTLRSGFTGKRNTTSILNSKAAERAWANLQIWANGIQSDRERAHRFVTNNGHFRLSVQDCAILQGFPEQWVFSGAVYKVLGQIGNSVVPVVGYHVARRVGDAILGDTASAG